MNSFSKCIYLTKLNESNEILSDLPIHLNQFFEYVRTGLFLLSNALSEHKEERKNTLKTGMDRAK